MKIKGEATDYRLLATGTTIPELPSSILEAGRGTHGREQRTESINHQK